MTISDMLGKHIQIFRAMYSSMHATPKPGIKRVSAVSVYTIVIGTSD